MDSTTTQFSRLYGAGWPRFLPLLLVLLSLSDHLLASLPDTAPLSWKPINVQNEYDFSKVTLRNLVNLDLDQLLRKELK